MPTRDSKKIFRKSLCVFADTNTGRYIAQTSSTLSFLTNGTHPSARYLGRNRRVHVDLTLFAKDATWLAIGLL